MTVWRQMVTKISVPDAAQPVELGKYLLGHSPDGEPDVAHEPTLQPLSDFRASLAHLGTLPVPRLEELMTGTLDLCSHRLDAWITSIATKRLAEMRKAHPTGVLVGGYGWVMNLAAAPAACAGAGAARRAGAHRAIAQRPGLRAHAVARAGGHGRGAAQRPSGARRR